MKSATRPNFKRNYETLGKHLKLRGLQPKTVEAYTRAVRRAGAYFDYRIDALTEQQLTDYFNELLATHSWSSVKLDLYGLKFYYAHVLRQPWPAAGLIKPPKTRQLPDILTVEEAGQLFATTRVLSYRVFYFTLYSLGLRLSEGLRLQVGDIDAARMRVHIRNSKGNKDRLVPLPTATLTVLRRFWPIHRNPVWVFPNRKGGAQVAAHATRALDRAGVQRTLRQVATQCGIKKRLPRTRFAMPSPPT